MLVTTISLKKKAQLLRRPHNESGDTCNFIPPHLLCHSHVTAPNISSTFFERSQGPPGMKGEAGKKRKREKERERWERVEKEWRKIRRAYFKQPLREQWNSLEGPPLAKGCRSCRYCGRRIKGLLWRKKRRRGGGGERQGELNRIEHRCPRIGIFRIIFFLRSTLLPLLFLALPSARSATLCIMQFELINQPGFVLLSIFSRSISFRLLYRFLFLRSPARCQPGITIIRFRHIEA